MEKFKFEASEECEAPEEAYRPGPCYCEACKGEPERAEFESLNFVD